MRKILTTFLLLLSCGMLHAQILINEYSCSNVSTVTDAYAQYNDWIELYNAGSTAVNLTGYYLSDDPANLTKWQIPAIAGSNGPRRKKLWCIVQTVVL